MPPDWSGFICDAGYDAMLMDWDNPAANHPEWPAETAISAAARAGRRMAASIALIWSNTTAFQQLQRFAHGDITLETYLRFVRGRAGQAPRALCLYASDAEIFDFRPGRFRTEEKLSGRQRMDAAGAGLPAVAARRAQ